MHSLRMHRTSVVVWVILIIGFFTAVAEENPSETFKLSGTVYDKDTHNGLPGVSVFFPALKKGTITDAHGHYVISGLKAGTYEVMAQIIGYGIYKKTIELNRSITLDITLTSDPLQIEGSTVTVDRDNVMDSYQSVTALDEGQLDQHRGQTLGETLKDVPGVSLLQTGPSIAKPVVRGLHSQRVVVLNDGVTQEGQQWGGEHAPEIDPFAAGSITVIRGASGLEYGAGAIGGVIRVEPSPLPEHAGIGGELSLNGFTNNRQMA
ncbi:MAG TPA: TonB-dependent receptor, partial [bacterium]|nr:TonB-dependent receptor [bacterium]